MASWCLTASWHCAMQMIFLEAFSMANMVFVSGVDRPGLLYSPWALVTFLVNGLNLVRHLNVAVLILLGGGGQPTKTHLLVMALSVSVMTQAGRPSMLASNTVSCTSVASLHHLVPSHSAWWLS